jgi:hypothetical protein
VGCDRQFTQRFLAFHRCDLRLGGLWKRLEKCMSLRPSPTITLTNTCSVIVDFLLSCPWRQQVYGTESLRPAGHFLAASVHRDSIKETVFIIKLKVCYLCCCSFFMRWFFITAKFLREKQRALFSSYNFLV